MKAVGVEIPQDILAKFTSFTSSLDVYRFIRNEELSFNSNKNDLLAIFDLSTIPLQWLQRRHLLKKMCILRSRHDVEAFIYFQKVVTPVAFNINDLVLVSSNVLVNCNENAFIRCSNCHYYSDIVSCFSDDGIVSNWATSSAQHFEATEEMETSFHSIRYLAQVHPHFFFLLTSHDFVFCDDLGISPTAIVTDSNQIMAGLPHCYNNVEIYVFLAKNHSILEVLSLISNQNDNILSVTGLVNFTLDDIVNSLLRV